LLPIKRILACAVVATAALAPAATAQAAPPSLGGTLFSASDPEIKTCGASGGAGSFTYEAAGTTTGAYAGTFTEAGTITVGPEDLSGRQRVVTVSIGFTIDSPAGQVTGTKQYAQVGDPNVNIASGRCWDNWGVLGGSAFIANDDLRYDATITTSDGQTCTQRGPVSLSLTDDSPVLADSFSSQFLNDAAAPLTCTGGEEPPPAEPTSKDDCKDGGWARFGFKNQGECIAWVLRGRQG
jgi:hypothetical protein